MATGKVTNIKLLLEHKISATPQQNKLPILEKIPSVTCWKIQDDLCCGCVETYHPSTNIPSKLKIELTYGSRLLYVAMINSDQTQFWKGRVYFNLDFQVIFYY